MLRFAVLICFLCLHVLVSAQDKKPVLLIHGGAGTILKSQLTPEKEAAYTKGLADALQSGYAILQKGGSSLDAVSAAVQVLEDNPLFNAGKGAVFTNAGKNEMDAAIMNGKTLAAGSVAGVTTIKNPITAARAVMEKSEHVMLTGAGAEAFAKQAGCTIVDPAYFYTEERWKALQRVKAADSVKALQSDSINKKKTALLTDAEYRKSKYGTVGAVALDKQGNLAAATSTGGMTNKKWGRVGDAPIIGCGTYADNSTCAVSCTGWGEYFIRAVVAKSISDQVKYAGLPVAKAAQNALDEVKRLGGDGGLIALDKNGAFTLPFNTEGMYRGYIDAAGKMVIEIFGSK